MRRWLTRHWIVMGVGVPNQFYLLVAPHNPRLSIQRYAV